MCIMRDYHKRLETEASAFKASPQQQVPRLGPVAPLQHKPKSVKEQTG